ncbi:MAG: hypothetical protein LBR79_02145 [Oscillospiraceae bacterium]|nr:hypothetical protein [Oscillospiraceae bacterium]
MALHQNRWWFKLIDNIFSPRLWRGENKGFQLFGDMTQNFPGSIFIRRRRFWVVVQIS